MKPPFHESANVLLRRFTIIVATNLCPHDKILPSCDEETDLRAITVNEEDEIHWLLENNPNAGYRAKITLLKDNGYNVPEIRRITNDHDNNIGLTTAVAMVLFPESMFVSLKRLQMILQNR